MFGGNHFPNMMSDIYDWVGQQDQQIDRRKEQIKFHLETSTNN
jgi:hypothetical protein